VASTATDADGGFLLADLTPGPYALTVSTESGTVVKRAVEAPAADLLIDLSPTTTVRGRVVEAATRGPVTRFLVGIGMKPSGEASFDQPGHPTQMFTAADGVFVMEDVPLGSATLTVQAEGYRTKEIPDLVFSADMPTPEIEVMLDAGLAIRGRVTSTEGGALADTAVSVTSGEEEGGASTDENGEYEVLAVAPGEVVLDFRKPGYRAAKRTLQVQQPTRVDVSLSRGLALRGVVVAGEAGVPKAQVHAQSSAADAESQSAVTDASGQFTLQGLVPGRYELTASAPEHGTAELHDVDVATAGSVRLVLERAATAILTGTVVGLGDYDAARPPIVMVNVQSEEGGGGQYGLVDMSGAFRIEEAPAGRVTV
jgi:protocatechuate 3,4-dioxygenase beta subunit